MNRDPVELERLFEEWHDCPDCEDSGVTVYEYMGLTWDEYKVWAAGPSV